MHYAAEHLSYYSTPYATPHAEHTPALLRHLRCPEWMGPGEPWAGRVLLPHPPAPPTPEYYPNPATRSCTHPIQGLLSEQNHVEEPIITMGHSEPSLMDADAVQ